MRKTIAAVVTALSTAFTAPVYADALADAGLVAESAHPADLRDVEALRGEVDTRLKKVEASYQKIKKEYAILKKEACDKKETATCTQVSEVLTKIKALEDGPIKKLQDGMVVLYGLTPSDAEYIKWRSDVSGYGRRLVQVEEALAKLNSKDRKAIDEVLEKILGTEFRRQAYLTASLNEDGTGICSNDLLQGKRQLVFSLGTNQCNPADASINSDARKHVQCLEKRINQPLNPEEDSVRARFERLNNFHQAQGILRTVETIKSECAAAKNELTEFDRYLTEVIRRNLTNRYQASGWEGSLELFGGLTQANNNDVDGFGGAKVCYGRADFIIRLCADAGILTHRYKSEPRTETKVQTTSQNLGSGYSEDSVLTTITEEGYKPLWFAGGRVEISPNNYLHFTLGADAYVVEDVTEETTKREAQMKFNGVNDEALYTVNKADTTRKTNVHGVPKAGAEACLGIFCLGGEAGYDLDAEKPVYEGKVGVRLGF